MLGIILSPREHGSACVRYSELVVMILGARTAPSQSQGNLFPSSRSQPRFSHITGGNQGISELSWPIPPCTADDPVSHTSQRGTTGQKPPDTLIEATCTVQRSQPVFWQGLALHWLTFGAESTQVAKPPPRGLIFAWSCAFHPAPSPSCHTPLVLSCRYLSALSFGEFA